MSGLNCVEIGDRLPDWVAGRLSASQAAEVAGHVASCADCAGQAGAIRAVWSARAEAPSDLPARISGALRAAEPAQPLRVRRWRQWVGSAAAVLALAVGSYVLRPGDPAEPVAIAQLGEVMSEESVWIADDGVVAGAPVLEDLSDDDLAALLEEMGG